MRADAIKKGSRRDQKGVRPGSDPEFADVRLWWARLNQLRVELSGTVGGRYEWSDSGLVCQIRPARPSEARTTIFPRIGGGLDGSLHQLGEFLGWCHVFEGLPGSVVELVGDGVEFGLGEVPEISFSVGEVLA